MRLPLPASLERAIWIRRERAKLARIPRVPADASRLGALDPARLEAIFQSVAVDAAWQTWSPRLRPLALPDGTGGVNPGDRRALFYLIAALRPARVLEIGTHIGASTLHIAAALRSIADGPVSPSLTSVDIADVNDSETRPWLRYGASASPREMLERLGLDFVEFETSPSLDYLASSDDHFDFIFLDGDHSATTVYRELPAALRRLAPGGYVLLHDYFPQLRPLWSDRVVLPGPFLAVERLLTEGASIRVLPLGALPWPTKQGSNITNLTLVAKP